jgi:hypothetical protein
LSAPRYFCNLLLNKHPSSLYRNEKKTVVGIDIGAKASYAFVLSDIPSGNYRDWFNKNRGTSCHRLSQKRKKNGKDKNPGYQESIDLFLSLCADVVVMEPTGKWYGKFWATLCEQKGIEIKWISHGDLAYNRKAYGFMNKADQSDAFSLALSYFDSNHNQKRYPWLFVDKGEVVDRIKQLGLELKGLDRSRLPQIQQLRQRLKFEFPELADRDIVEPSQYCKLNCTAWVGWLAGIHSYTRIENEYRRSVSHLLGTEISQYTRDHAIAIAHSEERELQIRRELDLLLGTDDLAPYIAVMEKIGFGESTIAIVLPHIYPIEKFYQDGKPWIDRWTDENGKKHKINRSLSAFQLSLGFGKKMQQSGDKEVLMFAGNELARKTIYAWTMGRVILPQNQDSWIVEEIDRRATIDKNPTVNALYRRWKSAKGTPQDKHKAAIKSGITLGYRVTRILYDELVKASSLTP